VYTVAASGKVEFMSTQLALAELEAGLAHIRQSPKTEGALVLIVRRPEVDVREVLPEGELSLTEGLVGDNWRLRGSSRTGDGSAHPDMQLNLINARALALIAQDEERWQLAGDQLIVDLSKENLPPGTQLALGTAIIEVTAQPHTGCNKFAARFGVDAAKWVNSPAGKELQLRGINARVVQPGKIRVGDAVTKIS
jgi:MOSC domain-containing protein YiiM